MLGAPGAIDFPAMSPVSQKACTAGHAADRLLTALDAAGSPVCVGLDPVAEQLPGALRPPAGDAGRAAAAIESFSLGVLDAICPHAACVKVQSACFERYGHRGVAALERVTAEASARGMQVILDAKRGDVSVSAEHYAAAAFGAARGRGPDWITVNGYLGPDAISPFLRPGFGAFVLVRTTNPGGDAVQAQRLGDGRSVAELVAGMVADLGRGAVGERGYSALGAVVGATRPGEIAALRGLMPQQVFLVPGFGAQGGGPADVRACFDASGRGAVVSASRSVIYAFAPGDPAWQAAVASAAERFAAEVAEAVGGRR
jgi:orotidine-5'-phosphate decarboxylase